MKLLFLKTVLYAFLILLSMEVVVRIFHLYEEQPVFIINDKNVKTYAPNQTGYSVTGNRKMNFAEYHINNSGFNSYREFVPSKDKTDVALLGDSFIEGLHQNYYNSIGKKIEDILNDGTEVFEYGHSGYDFADELHLMQAYKEKFSQIDEIIIYMKFENDLQRDTYEPDQYWIDSQYFLFSRIKRHIKLLEYMDAIGALDPLRNLKTNLLNLGRAIHKTPSKQNKEVDTSVNQKYIENFKKLIQTYGFDKNKTAILLDTSKTSKLFLDYCDSMGYKIIDFSKTLENSKRPTTLIYDMHWNNHGRSLIAKLVASYIKEKKMQGIQ